ncbi:acetyl-coenzyme A synthetase [Cutibacterium acnes JCM 18909]|nr:acetyl-coenzyme A synthetase [Cutibacterium acnes JCM 18909]
MVPSFPTCRMPQQRWEVEEDRMTNQQDVFEPDQNIVDNAWVSDWKTLEGKARAGPIAYWDEQAQELEWSKPWDKVLDDSNKPFFQWFTGAKTNIVTNAVDRHLSTARRNKLALIWVGENTDEVRTFSYFALNREVEQMANVLKAMGVRKGDVVTIYLPRIPEIFFSRCWPAPRLVRCIRWFFAGYSSEALNARIDGSESKVVITVDGSWINGKVFPMKQIVDDAVKFSPTVENVIVVRNTKIEVSMDSTRDHWYDELCKLPIAKGKCETVQVDAEDPLFILYTSGSTGKPKAIVHTHGGYQVGTYITLKQCFDIKEEDRWWCTADPGWITGHSYLVYGPLLNGATVFMHEGGPTYPYPDGWWQLIEHYGITSFYTAPTAIRTLMRFGDAGCANTICPVCAYLVRLASPSTRRLGAGSTMWSVTARVRSPIPGGRPKLACSRSPLCRRCRSNQVPLGVRSLARRLLLSTRRAMSSLRAQRASSSSKTRGRP